MTETGNERGRIFTLLEQKPVLLPAILGGLLVLPLPVASVVIKIVMCSYGLGSDLSGVYLFMPIIAMTGFALGFVAGLVGQGIGLLLEALTKSQNSRVMGALVGSVLAIISAVAVGLFAFAFFMFPDC